MQKDKIIKKLLITASILVLLIGVRMYLNYRSNLKAGEIFGDQTYVGWKTYTNTKYGYEIKYPPTWSFREFPDTKNGAGFTPDSEVSTPQTEVVTVMETGRAMQDCPLEFSEYVTVAGIHMIENFEKLNSIYPIKTQYGISGYLTTWDVRDMIDGNKHYTSGPFTYFKDPSQTCSNGTGEVWISLKEDTQYTAPYLRMINTFKFVKE